MVVHRLGELASGLGSTTVACKEEKTADYGHDGDEKEAEGAAHRWIEVLRRSGTAPSGGVGWAGSFEIVRRASLTRFIRFSRVGSPAFPPC